MKQHDSSVFLNDYLYGLHMDRRSVSGVFRMFQSMLARWFLQINHMVHIRYISDANESVSRRIAPVDPAAARDGAGCGIGPSPVSHPTIHENCL
jgi:hypothetical protein